MSHDRPLLDFLGYGPERPSLIFLGYDEYCDPRAIGINFEVRRKFPPRHDKNESCRDLEQACRDARLEAVADKYKAALVPGESVPTWTFASQFAQRFLARGLTWQQEYALLGSSSADGRTFLTERYPLPRPSHRFQHAGRDTRALTVQRRTLLKQRLLAPLEPGTVIVSYAKRPTDILGRMQRKTGRRAWEPIPKSRRGKKVAEVSQTDKHPVLSVPFPRQGDEPWWQEWMDAAVAAVKLRISTIVAPREAP